MNEGNQDHFQTEAFHKAEQTPLSSPLAENKPVIGFTRELRTRAPDYIQTLLKNKLVNGMENADLSSIHAIPLQGGEVSAVYLLQSGDTSRIVKFRTRGVSAEAQALQAWKKAGVKVPAVYSVNKVFNSENDGYLIMESVQDEDGNIAPTADQIVKDPNIAKEMGAVMGRELATMHKTSTDELFGKYADLSESNSTFTSWSEFLKKRVQDESSRLESFGLDENSIARLLAGLNEVSFPEKGVYVHGDVGMANVLVTSKEPLSIVFFDPNPLIGDPYWDLALIQNRFEAKNSSNSLQESNAAAYTSAIKESYMKSAGITELDTRRLAYNQLAVVLPSLSYTEKRINDIPEGLKRNSEIAKLDNKKMLAKRLVNSLLPKSIS